MGTQGDDTLVGTVGPDVICGLGGDDIIYGFGGDDILRGGSGHDVLYGGVGDDTLRGGKSRDILYGGSGRDTLHGGSSRDILYGGLGRDVLYAGLGDDLLWGGGGSDVLRGGPGMDTLVGGAGDDDLRGGPGRDCLRGGPGDDALASGRLDCSAPAGQIPPAGWLLVRPGGATPVPGPKDQQLAEAATLRPIDFPAGWYPLPTGPDDPGLVSCVTAGLDLRAVTVTAEARSAIGDAPGHRAAAVVRSTVTVFRNPKQAAKAFNKATAVYPGCALEALNNDNGGEPDPAASLDTVEPPPLGDKAAAWRIRVTADGRQAVHDHLHILAGRVYATITLHNPGETPTNPELTQQLAAALIERATTRQQRPQTTRPN
ncbi:MAG: calcium-binding protein [Actinomycetia bacterium]|nr:calcium-binding protein [Actinomycetes bacterium]